MSNTTKIKTIVRNEFHRFEQQPRFAEIEIIDGCNAKCVCCPRGIGLIPNTMKKMDISLYIKIIKKCVNYGVKGVALFNWGEPFLNNNISEYCKIAKENGLYVCLSSNMSFKNIEIENTLKFVDNLEISVSGFTQEIYEINHRGLNVEFVKNNIKTIERLLNENKINTLIKLKWFDYDYNKLEINYWNDFLDNNTKISYLIVEGKLADFYNRCKQGYKILICTYFLFDKSEQRRYNIKRQ